MTNFLVDRLNKRKFRKLRSLFLSSSLVHPVFFLRKNDFSNRFVHFFSSSFVFIRPFQNILYFDERSFRNLPLLELVFETIFGIYIQNKYYNEFVWIHRIIEKHFGRWKTMRTNQVSSVTVSWFAWDISNYYLEVLVRIWFAHACSVDQLLFE